MMSPSFACPAAFGGASTGRRPAAFTSGVPGNRVTGQYIPGTMGGMSYPPSAAAAHMGAPFAGSQDQQNQQSSGGGGGFAATIDKIIGWGSEVAPVVQSFVQGGGGGGGGSGVPVPMVGSKNPPVQTAQNQGTGQGGYYPQASTGVPTWVWGVGAAILLTGIGIYAVKS